VYIESSFLVEAAAAPCDGVEEKPALRDRWACEVRNGAYAPELRIRRMCDQLTARIPKHRQTERSYELKKNASATQRNHFIIKPTS